MAKTTWDVWVVLANNLAQTVAYVPRWKSIQLSDQLNDVGSATLEHDFSDPFFAAFQEERGDSLLDGPYALQIRRDGAAVFTFFIEDVQVDRAGTSQPLTIGGRGVAAALEWGIVLPEDFSNQTRATAGTTQRPRFFDRLFPGYAFNVRVATTGNLAATYEDGPQVDVPGAGARLTANANGSINNTGIDGVTDLVVGDAVLVKNQSSAAHNGIYWIVSIGGASTPWVLQRIARADGSPISDLEVGAAAFINEGTTNGYTSWEISSNGTLTNSNQVGTNSITWSQVSVGSFTGISAFYILFKEADSGYEYSTKKADFGTIKTLYGRGGIGYAVDWPLSLDSTLNSSLGKTDSKGRVVRDGGNFDIAVGRTLLDVLNEVSGNTGVDWHVSPSGVISIAVRPFVTDTIVFDIPFGEDLTTGSAALLFSLPMLSSVETRTSVGELRTVVYGSDGFNLDRQISERTGTYGFREMFIENTADDAPAVANITASAVRKVKDGKLQITAEFAERDGMVAWQDFEIGDKVLVEIDTGTFSERIISAIGASVDENGNETIEVTFGDIFEDIASNLKHAANYGRLSAAEIPAFTLRGTSSKPGAPTGTSVGAEVQGMSNRVVVNWESVDDTSTSEYEAIVYREEQDAVGIAITHSLVDIYRDGNIAYAQLSASSGFGVGDWLNIYDTTNNYFDRTNVFVTSASGVYFTFDDVGPDIATGTYTSGDVVRVVERHSTMVSSNKNSAAFENLAAPGREYHFTVLPYSVTGQTGEPSAPFAFTASASAQTLFNGAIRSNNYVADSTGWTIEASGDAEFNTITVRNGTWVQGTLTAPTIQTATTNPRIIVNSSGLYAYNNTGDIVTSILSSNGAFSTTSGTFSGQIDVGGNDSTSFHVDTAGNMWVGASASANAPFRVTNTGTLDVGGSDSTSFHVAPAGDIWSGASASANAPFKVDSTGTLTAKQGTIAGFDIGYADSPDSMHTGGNFLGTMDLGKLFAASSGDNPVHSDWLEGNGDSKAGIRIDGPGGVYGEFLYDSFRLYNGADYVQATFSYIETTGTVYAGAADISGTVYTDTIEATGTINTTGDLTADGILSVQGGAETGDMITAGGTGVYYNASNLAGDRFGIAFGWDNGAGNLTCIVNDDSNVDPYFVPDGYASDRRQKENIQPITAEVLEKIYGIKIYEFDYKSDLPQSWLQGKHSIGVMADELETLFPEFVYSDDNPEKYKQVVYSKMIPLLLGAIADLNARLSALESTT